MSSRVNDVKLDLGDRVREADGLRPCSRNLFVTYTRLGQFIVELCHAFPKAGAVHLQKGVNSQHVGSDKRRHALSHNLAELLTWYVHGSTRPCCTGSEADPLPSAREQQGDPGSLSVSSSTRELCVAALLQVLEKGERAKKRLELLVAY